ncbi:LOW QUALITY PROTEIN: glutathione peroxidase [Vibrio sp. JCM 18905]|nr:LOW QUALITY PROTEIN: glutathione peroxidase [Vibrio sp. JCM 18905]
MKGLLKLVALVGFISMNSLTLASECPDILQGKQRLLNSTEEVDLCESFKGKTLLVVNTASQCGFTPQFEQLETLYQTYKDQTSPLASRAMTSDRIEEAKQTLRKSVISITGGVTFPMMARSSVLGVDANPVFSEITNQAGIKPKWNFYKFLISSEGKVIATFPSSTSPTSTTLTNMIEQQL